jgi:hypothetical protein
VKCKVAGPARDVIATVAISRGHRIYAYRSGGIRHLVLHTRNRLRGRYVLTIEVRGYKPFRSTIRLR